MPRMAVTDLRGGEKWVLLGHSPPPRGGTNRLGGGAWGGGGQSPYPGGEREGEELAEPRRMTYDFYLEEDLSRKYELRRIRRICTFAKRIAAKTRKKEVRLAMRREIAQMTEERFQIQQELKDAIEAPRASLSPEVVAKLYKETIK